MIQQYQHPEPKAHGTIREIFDDVFFVTGAYTIKGKLPMSFSRNMTILRKDGELTLVNSVRLDEQGLDQLDSLGKVKHVIRLAAFHGADDPFYKDRYDATIWSVDAPYSKGFDIGSSKENTYLKPDNLISEESNTPIDAARFILLQSATPNEAFMLLPGHQGILIAGDCLQNWRRADQYFNFFAKVMMKLMGFIKAYNVGPAWLKGTKPQVSEIHKLLELDFEHLLPAHGEPVISNAKRLYKPAIESCKQY